MPESIEKRTYRVAIVMPLGHQQGGAELLLMHLLEQGSKRFNFVCVFLEDGPMVDKARSLGYATFVRPISRISDLRNYLATVLWFRTWLGREKPDLVLSWMPKSHLYVAPAAFFSGIKLTWFQHGISNHGMMDRVTTMLPADRVLCCSEAAKAAQDRISPHRPTSVCYPGVSFPSASPIPKLEARAKLGLDANARIVGMVARLERWKGPHVFIEAARAIDAALPGTYFFIVGGAHPRDPAYAEEIGRLAATSGLGDRILLMGQRPSAEIPLWQASADIIVHPVTSQEPFGMAVAEALGMGKVVVASRAGGPEEIIEEGVSGFLVPTGDAPILAETVLRLLADPAEIRRVEGNALDRGRQYSISAFVNRLDELLSNVLEPESKPG